MKIMRKYFQKNSFQNAVAFVICGICSLSSLLAQPATGKNKETTFSKEDAKSMPVYGNWRNFTTKDGLPSDHAYTVRIIGDSVLVGTHDGLCVYSKGKWHTYTTKDGLAHNGVVSIDYSELTGD